MLNATSESPQESSAKYVYLLKENSMSHPQSDDLIDSLLGLNPDGTTWQARRFREKARQGTQDSYDTLFSSELSLALDARWLVALYASRLSKAPELSAHYLGQAQAHSVDDERI